MAHVTRKHTIPPASTVNPRRTGRLPKVAQRPDKIRNRLPAHS